MQISDALIRHYVSALVQSYPARHDLPPDDLAGYRDDALNVRRWAEDRGDLEVLRLGFDHVLGDPSVDAEALAGDGYGYDADEVRAIMAYARTVIWPDAAPVPVGGPPDVQLAAIPLETWRRDHPARAPVPSAGVAAGPRRAPPTRPTWIEMPAGRFQCGLGPDQVRGLAEDSAAVMRRRLEAEPSFELADEVERFAGNLDYLVDMLTELYRPVEVELDAFAIARAPVTCGEWREFMDTTGARQPSGWSTDRGRPVLGVSWAEAAAYAAWAGHALPSEAQWERAARGTGGRLFPWSDQYGRQGAWLDQADLYEPWPPGSRPDLTSPDGCWDLVTRRWEWCADAFAYPAGSDPARCRAFYDAVAGGRVLRGGELPHLIASSVTRAAGVPDRPHPAAALRLVRVS